ncbi:MAG: aspartate kinase [Acidobacteriota bacterium]
MLSSRESRLLIMKFGGTSVGNSEAISKTVEMVRQGREEWNKVVVVVSALGGVTDLLLEGARTSADGCNKTTSSIKNELRGRHFGVIEDLLSDDKVKVQARFYCEKLLDRWESLCNAIRELGETTPRALDAVSSIGEKLSSHLVALALDASGISSCCQVSTEFFITDSNFQAAHPDMSVTREKTRAALFPLLENGIVPVVTGFIGSNSEGVTTTLGRGGSDYSAAILAAVLEADEVWICTDVNGVMSADPRIVPEAMTIPELSFQELAELAFFGARVVHPMTVRPVVEAGINLVIKNTFDPSHPGTRLIADSEIVVNGIMKAVTSFKGQRLITVEGRGMLGVPGVAARTFSAVAATGTNVILIIQASSEQSISFAVPCKCADKVIEALTNAFALELSTRDIDRISTSGESAIITAVGSGMCNKPEVFGKIFSSLGKNDLNVNAIAQGPSSVSVSLVVDAGDAEQAVRSLHSLVV